MKPALFYAIRRNNHGDPDIVAVTTLKGRRWYGRRVRDDNPTHGRGDIDGEFATVEAAEAMIKTITQIRSRFAGEKRRLRHEISMLDVAENQAIADALKAAR